jgi:hypothetical protein
MNYATDELFSSMVPSVETTPVTRLTEHMAVFHPRVNNYIITPTITEEHIKYIPNTRKLLYDILQKPRNVMLPLNDNRQAYTAKYILHHDTIDDDFQQLIKLYTGFIKTDDELSHNKLGLINELLFMYFNEFNYRATLPTYKTPTKYQQYKVDTEKYEIVKFSRDINEKFRHMEEHFEELKELLKYNPDTGFYTYDDIPILCRHVYMIYDNKSLQEMAAECYADGHCKYCGTSMMNYGDLLYDDVPLAVQSLLLAFSQSFENDIDSNGLYYKLYGILTKILRDNKDKLNKDSTTLAFSGLFILKILKECAKSDIKFDQKKLSKILDKIRDYTTQMGWTPQQIESTIENNPMLKSLDNINELIKAFQFHVDTDTIFSTYLSSILGDIRAPNDEARSRSIFKQIFDKGQLAIDEYNKKYNELMLKLWHYNYDPVIRSINDIDINMDALNIKNTVERNGIDFFKRICKTYCPAAIEQGSCDHKWSGDSCSLCGLKKDGSNAEAVYKKYFRTITERSVGTHIDEPVFGQSKSIQRSPENIIKDIESVNAGQLDILPKIYANPKAKYMLIRFIINMLNINEILIKDTNEFYNKCIAYMLTNKLIDKEDLFNNLLFMYELNKHYSYI